MASEPPAFATSAPALAPKSDPPDESPPAAPSLDDKSATLATPRPDRVLRPAEPLFSDGELVAGRYRILNFLARGGMGEVYAATDEELETHVALKAVLPELALRGDTIERFRREINLARRITHRNVCRLHEFGVHEPDKLSHRDYPVRFLTMELLHGETLAERLDRGPLEPEVAAVVGHQLAEGLDAAHSVGVVHRDLKPSNVMLVHDARGLRAVITDFGLSRPIAPDTGDDEPLTASGQMMGTLAYVAPEQLEGGSIGPHSDLYALGVLLYEAVAGRAPFVGQNALQASLARLDNVPEDPRRLRPELDPRWSRLLLRCLERKPADRPADASSLAREIRPLAGGALAEDRPSAWRSPLLVGLLLVVAALTALWFARPTPEPLPRLTVAILPPAPDDAASPGDLAAAGFEAALLSALSDLEGIDPVDPTVLRLSPPADAIDAIRRTGADEVVTLSARRLPAGWEFQTRRVDADGIVRFADLFRAPADDRAIQAGAISVSLGRAFPDRVDEKFGEPVDAATWETYLDLYRDFYAPPAGVDRETTLERATALRKAHPSFFEIQLLEGRAAGYLAIQTQTPDLLERAFERLEVAQALEPDDPRPLFQRANFALSLNRLDVAIPAILELERIRPTASETVLARARLELAQHRPLVAVKLLEQAVALRPSTLLRYRLADARARAGLMKEAKIGLRKILKSQPGDFFATKKLAEIELIGGDIQAALALYAPLAEQHNEAGILVNTSLIYLLLRDWERSIYFASKAAELYPEQEAVHLNLGDAYTFAGRTTEALASYEEVVLRTTDSSSAVVWSVRAQALAHLGRVEEALKLNDKALEVDDQDPEALFAASIIHLVAGNEDLALDFGRKSLERGMSEQWFNLPWFDKYRNAELLADPTFELEQ